jgi:hypothetical protein
MVWPFKKKSDADTEEDTKDSEEATRRNENRGPTFRERVHSWVDKETKRSEEKKQAIDPNDESTHDHEERARFDHNAYNRKSKNRIPATTVPDIEGQTIRRRATYNPISDEETHRRAVDAMSNFESHEDSNNNGTPKDKNLKTKEETHRAAVTFIESNINDTERENPFYNALQKASEDAHKKKAAGNKADEPPADETSEQKKYRQDLFERDKRKLDINLRDLGRKLSPQAQEHTGDLLAHERFMQNKQMKEEKFSTTMPGKLEHMAISLTKEGAKAFGTSGKSAKDKLPKHSKKGKPPHRESYSSRAISMYGGGREGSSGNLYQGVAMESANMRQRQYFGNGQGPPVVEQNQAAPLTERPPLDYFGPAKNMEHFGSSKQKKTSDFNIGNIGIGGNRNLRDLGIGKRRGSLDLGIGGKKSQTEYGVGKKMAQKDFGIGKGLDIGIGNGKKQSFDFSKELGIGGNGKNKKQKFY